MNVRAKEPLILNENVLDINGQLIMPAGMSITKSTLSDMPTIDLSKNGKLADTPFYTNLLTLPDDEEYSVPLENKDMRETVLHIIREIEIPLQVAKELIEMRKRSTVAYLHTLGTTLLVTRAMLEVSKSEDDAKKVARANLVKDLGMSRLPKEILTNRDHLARTEYAQIKRHPAIGMVLAYHYFGEGLESMVALRHHERRGKGYPLVAADKPNQIVDLITTIDIFNALVSPRSFRRDSFNIRGAIDELLVSSRHGEIPLWGPKLIASMYRTDTPSLEDVELSEERLGFVPESNYYGLEA